MFPGKHTTWAAALTTYKRCFVWNNKVVRPSGQVFFPLQKLSVNSQELHTRVFRLRACCVGGGVRWRRVAEGENPVLVSCFRFRV